MTHTQLDYYLKLLNYSIHIQWGLKYAMLNIYQNVVYIFQNPSYFNLK